MRLWDTRGKGSETGKISAVTSGGGGGGGGKGEGHEFDHLAWSPDGRYMVGGYFGGGVNVQARMYTTPASVLRSTQPTKPPTCTTTPPFFPLTQMRAQAAVMDYQHLVTFDVRKGQALGRPRNMRADVRRDAC